MCVCLFGFLLRGFPPLWRWSTIDPTSQPAFVMFSGVVRGHGVRFVASKMPCGFVYRWFFQIHKLACLHEATERSIIVGVNASDSSRMFSVSRSCLYIKMRGRDNAFKC